MTRAEKAVIIAEYVTGLTGRRYVIIDGFDKLCQQYNGLIPILIHINTDLESQGYFEINAFKITAYCSYYYDDNCGRITWDGKVAWNHEHFTYENEDEFLDALQDAIIWYYRNRREK